MKTETLKNGLKFSRTENWGVKIYNSKTLNLYVKLSHKGDYESMERIKNECDPQEVYLYEYNNKECMYSWNGDEYAFDEIIKLFGKDVANKIHRIK